MNAGARPDHLADVDADVELQTVRRCVLVREGRAFDGIFGPLEEREDTVAGSNAVFGLAVAALDGGAELLVHCLGAGEIGLVAQFLGEPRRVDDVGEEEHDGVPRRRRSPQELIDRRPV